VAVSDDGKLAVSSASGIICVWDVATGKTKLEIKDHEGVAAVALAGDSKQLVTGYRRKVIIWDLTTFKQYKTISVEEASVACLSVSRDYIAIGMSDLSVLLYDRASLEKLYTFDQPEEFRDHGELRYLRFDEKGTRLVFGLNQAKRLFQKPVKQPVVWLDDRRRRVVCVTAVAVRASYESR
jgi:WD40 repeat protein